MTKFEFLREQALAKALCLGNDRVYIPKGGSKFLILGMTWDNLQEAVKKHILHSPVGTEIPHEDFKTLGSLSDDDHTFLGIDGFCYRFEDEGNTVASSFKWERTENINREDVWRRVA